ncbi:hypothetical protein RRG08_059765 [Elysia crispata]|uniref:Uncharacterized protein n=1 Tax=Elysia crispata TaxID=231223 RepID=A0AAE1BDD9_9GAST|nr:hypothetical protein RRG08_059765 [Elysia crispata]
MSQIESLPIRRQSLYHSATPATQRSLQIDLPVTPESSELLWLSRSEFFSERRKRIKSKIIFHWRQSSHLGLDPQRLRVGRAAREVLDPRSDQSTLSYLGLRGSPLTAPRSSSVSGETEAWPSSQTRAPLSVSLTVGSIVSCVLAVHCGPFDLGTPVPGWFAAQIA